MNPGPWKFHERLFIHGNVVVDKDGQILASHVGFANGPLIAAAPSLLEFVQAIAKRQDELGEAARRELKALDLGITAERPRTGTANALSLRSATILASAEILAGKSAKQARAGSDRPRTIEQSGGG